jgi:TonB family protein
MSGHSNKHAVQGILLGLLLACFIPQGHAQAQGTQQRYATPAVLGIVNLVKPVAPRDAQGKAMYGVVTLGFLVGESGQVLDTELLKSSGAPEVDRAALDAIRQSRFVPPKRDGRTVQAWSRMQSIVGGE